MSDNSSTEELLVSIETKLNALIALTAYGLMESDDYSDPSYPSLDSVLVENGMSNADSGRALGKSPDAVRMQVNRDRTRG